MSTSTISSTTTFMLNIETSLYLVVYTLIFALFILWILYFFWPIKNNDLIN